MSVRERMEQAWIVLEVEQPEFESVMKETLGVKHFDKLLSAMIRYGVQAHKAERILAILNEPDL